ncbi:TetR/AcrR family transcriptional regulator [Mycobacterium sp. CVI_P3]|uniref:TetR/AcrR family transcriptional regulator n=1 Tax=Mycobacterium pinniadriaticum TaxID=2994102 RepID=A0ABT3S8W9_9MYCO|nr:TetR/AcrR family transcriptional regulator [Mycobacterium pinniadriaticum]MCX2929520.1 TetR/AcrR family transcriptional regulator [Mycobacterium pinniadriaticum]MCX2935944.1 TetR/AcrR family transcriptional regulator [Mycobacterium pinniadriaticum]
MTTPDRHIAATGPEPVRGRPRNPRTDEAIMAATRRLLVDVGYDQVSMESIARAAGVSRPTIYRRWPSKAHVVFEAAFGTDSSSDGLPRTGDFESDLREFVRGSVAFWREPVVEAATMGILADRHRDAELHIRTQQLLDDRIRGELADLVRDGAAQGVVRADIDADTLFNVLVGTTFYGALVDGRDETDHLVDTLCSLVMRGAQVREKEC